MEAKVAMTGRCCFSSCLLDSLAGVSGEPHPRARRAVLARDLSDLREHPPLALLSPVLITGFIFPVPGAVRSSLPLRHVSSLVFAGCLWDHGKQPCHLHGIPQ